MSFAEIVQHISDSDEWLFKKLENEAITSILPVVNPSLIYSREEFNSLVDGLNDLGKKRSNVISAMLLRDLDTLVYDDRFNSKVSRWWIIVRGNLDHEIHHRGQLALYLKLIAQNHDA